MKVAGHWKSFIQKMQLELEMVTVEWRWPFKLVNGQDKLYCIMYNYKFTIFFPTFATMWYTEIKPDLSFFKNRSENGMLSSTVLS